VFIREVTFIRQVKPLQKSAGELNVLSGFWGGFRNDVAKHFVRLKYVFAS
jgi:hypothetical protein